MAKNALHPEDQPLFASNFSAVGDTLTDDTIAIRAAIEAAINTNKTLYLESGKTYRISQELSFIAPGRAVKIMATGSSPANLLIDIPRGVALTFSGASYHATTLTRDVQPTDTLIATPTLSTIKPGDLCELVSTRAWYHDPRPPSGWSGFNMGIARGGTSRRITLAENFSPPPSDVEGRALTLIDGRNVGHSAIVEHYNPATKEVVLSRELPYPVTSGTNYIFPQAFKGGLNVVQGVYEGEVQLLGPLFDSYDVETTSQKSAKEEVSVRYVNPIKVHLEGLKIAWATHPKFSNAEAVRLKYGSHSTFRDVEIESFRRIGFQIERSFNTLVDFCRVTQANSRYLGYGVNVQNSTQTTIKNSYFWGCRRGIDFDSVRDFNTAYPSRLGLVDSCTNYGGGTREEGLPIATPWYPGAGWEDSKAHNYGFGSHGPAEYITYTNNTIINTYRGIFVRGTNERIINNRFVGKMEECIGIWFGGNCTVEGNEYLHPWSTGDVADDENVRMSDAEHSSAFLRDVPKRFTGIAILRHSPTSYQRGLISIRNNIVRGVSREFVYHEWAAGKYLEDIIIEGNHIWYYAERDTTLVHLLNSNNSAEVNRVTDKNNRINVVAGRFKAFRSRLKLGDSCSITPHPSNRFSRTIENSEETPVLQQFLPDREPGPDAGVAIGAMLVQPYSTQSNFSCSFEGSFKSSTELANVVIAIFRNDKCVGVRMASIRETSGTITVAVEINDKPESSSAVTYSVRLGTDTHDHKAVLNPSSASFGRLNRSSFRVTEN